MCQQKLFKLKCGEKKIWKEKKRKSKKYDSKKKCNTGIIGKGEGEERKKVICEAIMAQNFPKLMADRKRGVKHKNLKFYS